MNQQALITRLVKSGGFQNVNLIIFLKHRFFRARQVFYPDIVTCKRKRGSKQCTQQP